MPTHQQANQRKQKESEARRKPQADKQKSIDRSVSGDLNAAQQMGPAARPISPAGVLHLQGTIGNQRVARLLDRQTTHQPASLSSSIRATPARNVIQRAIVAPSAYLTGLIVKNGADPEWDPHWTPALNQVVLKPEFAMSVPATMDDAVEGDILKLLGILKGLAGLSSDKPNRYKAAIDAVRWDAGIESDSGGSGFGSLDTSDSPISGRPAFPALTQVNVPLKAGQHRRHIVPWHAIREFVSMAYGAKREVVISTIWKTYGDPPDKAVEQAFAEAYKHVLSGREKTGGSQDVLSDEEWLKVGLFVMNGNPRNLWAGKGSTNSAINTAQMHMNGALDKVTTFKGLSELAETWKAAKGKMVYSTATALGADVLSREGQLAYEQFLLVNNPLKEADFAKLAVEKVRQYVVSNLELDVVGDVKAQTEIAQEKAQALKEPLAIIDHVVTGKVKVAEVEPAFIETALREFMTYMK
ncbi:hypothetical protein TFLX_03172 [Thermoflexales bacterium]|nr:hypothetical protein TFLX_03172 [Thermoflexales bacterium]